MAAIFRRELQAYFLSPIGYAFMGFFLMVAGLFFTVSNLFAGSASFVTTLSNMSFIFMLLVPILTMRLMAEDRKSKTDQMLLTAPVSVTSVVMGKYLAALAMFAITLAVTFIYPFILSRYGTLPVAEMVGGYLGFFLLGASFISVGLFMSTLSENQVTAAASTFAVLLAIYLMDVVTPYLNQPWLVTVLQWFSAYSRFEGFATGVLALSPVLYYLSFTGVFLFLSIRAVEKRRWSEG
nr:ABC transporter permease [bacterium]